MDESLFKRLEHHSDAVVQLNVQYRMNRWGFTPVRHSDCTYWQIKKQNGGLKIQTNPF